jgi:hypothetical protein
MVGNPESKPVLCSTVELNPAWSAVYCIEKHFYLYTADLLFVHFHSSFTLTLPYLHPLTWQWQILAPLFPAGGEL